MSNQSGPQGFGYPQGLGLFTSASEYFTDAAQRTVLYWDVMRQRGNQYQKHLAETAPHVLEYKVELVLDGRKFERPVNYVLARILPPAGVKLDNTRRPFVVVDPRAGHGPGIGGFKADSEIGVAMKAGHPCYFVGFLPDPMPGQTIGDVARAEAIFLEKVIELHPQADGKPCVIGNCQAGWAVMMLAALRPELFGPIIVAGSPLSYWAGPRGKDPMRYTGGLLGGSWLAEMTSDLGMGKFDGAWLVQNFENLNPANTLWSKQYNLYSNIDTEGSRYLSFEKWWGGHVNLNREEIQFIVDELFVGNNLAAARIKTSEGVAIDLRNIRSPIVVFCSKGDNITPPQQALGWILDLYDSVDDIRAYGQTIVYSVHETVGHLGIFVSGSIAKKEHDELASNIDLIDTLPPGLYEAVFERKGDDSTNPDLASGQWIMRCENRTLDDIRALGGFDDDRMFATVAQVSKTNLALYRMLAQPFVRAMATPLTARWMQEYHPLRLPYEILSDQTPLAKQLENSAKTVSENRKPAAEDNPFVIMEKTASAQIETWLDAWRGIRDAWAENAFLWIYGSPALQAWAGVDRANTEATRKASKSTLHQTLLENRIAGLNSRIGDGGLREATIRSLLYVGMARGAVDERGFEMVRRIRAAQREQAFSIAEFKQMVRDQFYMLLLNREAAVAAIPSMLPDDVQLREKAFKLIEQTLKASGEPTEELQQRLREVSKLFGLERSGSPSPSLVPIPPGSRPDPHRVKAS